MLEISPIQRRIALIRGEEYPKILDKKIRLKVPVGNLPKGKILFGGIGKRQGVETMWVEDHWIEPRDYSQIIGLNKRDKRFIERQKQ